jgi:hypothetical protein
MADWLQRVKGRIEKLVFAGLKPDAPVVPKKSKLEALIATAEDLAARGLQPDERALPGPVTTRRKVVIAVGVFAVALGVFALVRMLQQPAKQGEAKGPQPPPLELVPKGLVIEKNKDLEVISINFNRTKEPHEITGTLRNHSGKLFAKCEVSFELTDQAGAQLGGVSTIVHNLPAGGATRFSIPVAQPDAVFAMVRELRPE